MKNMHVNLCFNLHKWVPESEINSHPKTQLNWTLKTPCALQTIWTLNILVENREFILWYSAFQISWRRNPVSNEGRPGFDPLTEALSKGMATHPIFLPENLWQRSSEGNTPRDCRAGHMTEWLTLFRHPVSQCVLNDFEYMKVKSAIKNLNMDE